MAQTTSNTVPDASGARQLWDLVSSLNVPFGYERSFRLCRGTILRDRFLLSLGKGSLGTRPDATVLDLCRRLELPEHFLRTVAQALPAARFVHFGFERGRTGCLYKVYLETGLPAGRTLGPCPVLLHRAVKWDPSDPSRCVLSAYYWYHGLTVTEVLERMTRIYDDPALGDSFAVARSIALLAAERIGPEGVRYLEVVEDGNPRRSFDLNLYPAGLTVGDVFPQLSRIALNFAIDAGLSESLLEEVRPHAVGHLAGGIHRAGEDFFTVYHGAQEGRNAIGADA